MTTFRQINKDEWQTGDYRPSAEILRKSEELFPNHQVIFDEYLEEGMGKVKVAYFLTSNNKQFAVAEYLLPEVPITEIIILNNPDTITKDLNEVLELLRIKYSDLNYVHKW